MADFPAFPHAGEPEDHDWYIKQGAAGMTLRDYFAAQAISAVSGYVATGSHLDPSALSHAHTIAEHAYMIADMLLMVRDDAGDIKGA